MMELKAFFRCLAAHVKMEMMYRTHLVVGLVSASKAGACLSKPPM